MRTAHLFRSTVLLCAALLSAGLALAEDIQSIHPTGYVTDLAGVIGAQKKAALQALGTELEQKTGAQMAIVTVRSLDGESVDSYAVDLYKQLGVGSKKDNRGVMLLVAPNDRKYRIEVGYGLEPVINDARAGDAGRAMVPFLRANDYGTATVVAAKQLAGYIADDAGVTLSGLPPSARNQGGGGGSRFPLFWVILVGVIVFFRAVSNVSGRGGRGSGGGGGL